jgi:hypothetical protein
MPREAYRITLETIGVRVERLQDISEGDSSAEGTSQIEISVMDQAKGQLLDMPLTRIAHPYRNGCARLWESINGPDAWAANPWCGCGVQRVEAC